MTYYMDYMAFIMNNALEEVFVICGIMKVSVISGKTRDIYIYTDRDLDN
jgi:hypothetical protein